MTNPMENPTEKKPPHINLMEDAVNYFTENCDQDPTPVVEFLKKRKQIKGDNSPVIDFCFGVQETYSKEDTTTPILVLAHLIDGLLK